MTMNTGRIYLLSAHTSIDREKYDAFRFPILAVDMGSTPRTGSALIVITMNTERT